MDTTSNQLLRQELKMLQQEKGKICISIIIPFDHSPDDQKTARKHVEKAIEAVSDQLLSTPGVDADTLIKSIKDLYNRVDVEHHEAGVGLFVSESVSHYTWFPFSVKEKITISNSFDLRDNLYKLQCSIPYYVLFFDRDEARLYSGNQKRLLELKNKAFPLQYYDETVYEMVSATSSFSPTRRGRRFERSTAEKERFETFFREADELLSLYIEGADALILCGTRLYTAAFVNRCRCPEKIISIINGSHDWFNSKDLIDIVWPSVKQFTLDIMIDEISTFEDKVNEGLAEKGIVDVWRAVAEGRGLTLLVEKDLRVRGFLTGKKHDQFYYHRPPQYPHDVVTHVRDAINELSEMALDKNTEIVFVENGMLDKYEGVGLITRF